MVTSYVKHGWEIDTIQTFNQVQDYLGSYTVPWVWGGDFNWSPDELIDRGITIPAQAHTPKGEWSTCTVGAMIDYFLTPSWDQCPVEECTKINSTTIKLHYPVQIMADQRPQLTKVLGPVGAKKWREAEPIQRKRSWKVASKQLSDMGRKVLRFSTSNPMQDLYLNQLGIRNESIELGEM